MSLTQYLEFQKNQDMTRLLNFTRTQKKRREGFFVCFGMKENEIIPLYKIYMVKERTLDGGPKGRGKEELGEGK